MPKYVKKYELTNQKMTLKKGLVLYRIKALRDFASVRRGDLGGWLQHEGNLATDYNLAWLSGNAMAYGEARVVDDAWVSGNAKVYGQALINEQANVEGNATVYGNATVSDDSTVGENSRVYGFARVTGNAQVFGHASIFGEALVSGKAMVYDNSTICGNARVYGEARIFGNAEVRSEAVIRCKAYIGGDARIESTSDYVSISPINGHTVTFTKCGMVFSSCFGLTWNELLAECRKNAGSKLYVKQYRSAIKFAMMLFERLSS